MYIFWQIFDEIVENQDLNGNKDDFWKKKYILIEKILYFISISLKCILWQILNEIVVKKRYTYTYRKMIKENNFFYLEKISVNCMSCGMKGLKKKCDRLTDRLYLLTYLLTEKVIHRGAPV